MSGETRSAVFEAWMNAALWGGDWPAAATSSAALLQARALALVHRDGGDGAVILHASRNTPVQFLRICGDLAKTRAMAPADVRDDPDLGRIAWTRVKVDTADASELVFVALFDGLYDEDLFRDVARFAGTASAAKARLSSVRAASALKMAAFDQLPFGVVIVDSALRVVEANDAGRKILSRSDGMSLARDRLHCREAYDQNALGRAIGRALGGEASASVIKVRRRRGAQPYVVRVVTPRGDARSDNHCLLMIVNPDEAPPSCSEIWRAMFDLTDCEIIIAEGLVNGQRINDIALQRGVSIETVRTQTKRMFERLNVSSQAEAAARLSRTAPFWLSPIENRDLETEPA